jgi:hypothetical protein
VPTILRLFRGEPRPAAGTERLGSGIPCIAVRRRAGERHGRVQDEEGHGEHPCALAPSETNTPLSLVADGTAATLWLVDCPYTITMSGRMNQP